jgi:hypothetical protein
MKRYRNSVFISSFPPDKIGKAGFSTRRPDYIRTGCYGISGPVPSAVLDKNYIYKRTNKIWCKYINYKLFVNAIHINTKASGKIFKTPLNMAKLLYLKSKGFIYDSCNGRCGIYWQRNCLEA